MARLVHKDKDAIIQVLGCLIKQPMLLLEEKYRLIKADFPEMMYEAIFVSIDYLLKNGAPEIDCMAIFNFLQGYPSYYKAVEKNGGIRYIENCENIAELGNFEYYYTKLKKLSLLNQLERHGFPTVHIYDPSICDSDAYVKMQAKFDSYAIEDIFNQYDGDLASLKETYSVKTGSSGCQAAKGLTELLGQYKITPEMGMPFNSPKLTTIFRGRRLKKLYIKTAPSGIGKTRISTGDACCVSVPSIYDTKEKCWKQTGCAEPTLLITTELEISEIQTLIVAYVSGVPEEKILDGKCDEEEESRIAEAVNVIENSPLYIEHVPNFNIDDIENTVRKYKARRGIGYVFFDYIHTSIKILAAIASKTRGVSIREDNVLMMFSDRMKTLANSLNIHVDTSTQANGDWKHAKDADNSLIQGSKAIANKADCGCVVLPLQDKDKEFLKTVTRHGFHQEPNLIYSIYKNRRGSLNNIKLWVYFDYSTCRTTDIFATTKDNVLTNIENTNIDIVAEQIGSELEDDTPWY